jgi:DNA-binding response OmpR family regulator
MKRKVLVAEDEAGVLELMVGSLERDGFEVFTVGRGLELLNRARALLPDLIILDLLLPDIDGLAVCQILRRLPSTASIPIILLTADASEMQAAGMENGVDDYLAKPFEAAELALHVSNTLWRSQELDLRESGIVIERNTIQGWLV